MTPFVQSNIRPIVLREDYYGDRVIASHETSYIEEMSRYYARRYGTPAGYILIGKRVYRDRHAVKLRFAVVPELGPYHQVLADIPDANQYDWRFLRYAEKTKPQPYVYEPDVDDEYDRYEYDE